MHNQTAGGEPPRAYHSLPDVPLRSGFHTHTEHQILCQFQLLSFSHVICSILLPVVFAGIGELCEMRGLFTIRLRLIQHILYHA